MANSNLDASGQTREAGKNYSYSTDKSGKIVRTEISSSPSKTATSSTPASSNKTSSGVSSSNAKQVTFTDIGGKTHTTDQATYDRWNKAGNVASTDESSIGADTVSKLIDAQVKAGKISQEEATRRKQESYASEGALVHATTTYDYRSYSAPNQYTQQQYVNPYVSELIASGKTTPDMINQELGKDYVKDTAFVMKYGGGWVSKDNLPNRVTIENTYAPTGQKLDSYSSNQLATIDLVNQRYGSQMFVVDSNGFILINPNLSNEGKKTAQNIANTLGIGVGNQINLPSYAVQNKGVDLSKGDQVINNLNDYEQRTGATQSVVDTDKYWRNESGTYYDVTDKAMIPKYTEYGDELYKVDERINSQGETVYDFVPKGYYRQGDELVPVGFVKQGDEYFNSESQIYFKRQNDTLVPSYKYVDTTNKNMSSIEKEYVINKDGEYYFETKTTSTEQIIPEGFKLVNQKLTLPIGVADKSNKLISSFKMPDTYEKDNIYYNIKDNQLIPNYTYIDGVKYKFNQVLPDMTLEEATTLVNAVGKGESVLFVRNKSTLSPAELRMNEAMKKQHIYDDIELNKLPDYAKPIANNIIDLRDTFYKTVTKGQVDVEKNIDDFGKWYRETGYYTIPIASSSVLINMGVKEITGFELPIKYGAEISWGVSEIVFKTPSKIIGGYTRGTYEAELYRQQNKYGFQEDDFYSFGGFDIPKSAVDSTVLYSEATIYALPIFSGVASGLSSIGLKTGSIIPAVQPLTSTSVKGMPLIFKAGFIGGGLGVAKEGYDIIIDNKEFNLDKSLSNIARTSGNAMGFVGVSYITSSALETGFNAIYRVDDLLIKNPSLTQSQGSFKSDYGFAFKKVSYQDWIRKGLFDKGQGLGQPDLKLLSGEQVNYIGIQKIVYKGDTPITFQFAGRNTYQGLTQDGVFLKGDYYNLPKGQYMNIDQLTRNKIISGEAIYTKSLSTTNLWGKPISTSLSESLSYSLGKTTTHYKSSTGEIDYTYDVSRSVGQTFTRPYTKYLDPDSFISPTTTRVFGSGYGFTYKSASKIESFISEGDTYSRVVKWNFAEPSINYKSNYDLKTINNKDMLKYNVEHYNIKNDYKIKPQQEQLYSTQDKSLAKNYLVDSKTGSLNQNDYIIKDINVNKNMLSKYQEGQPFGDSSYYGFKRTSSQSGLYTYAPPVNSYLPLTIFKPYVTYLNPITFTLPQNKVTSFTIIDSSGYASDLIKSTVYKTPNVLKSNLINENVNKEKFKEVFMEDNLTPLSIKNIENISYKPIDIYQTDYVYTNKYIYENIYIPTPVIPITPIPPLPLPPIVAGGSYDPYLFLKKGTTSNILDKRIRLASMSASIFGTRSAGKWRGTSLDTREDVLPARRYTTPSVRNAVAPQFQSGIKKPVIVKKPKVKSTKVYKGLRLNTTKKK